MGNGEWGMGMVDYILVDCELRANCEKSPVFFFHIFSQSQSTVHASLIPRPIRAMPANRATSRRLIALGQAKNGKRVPDFGEKVPDLCFR